MPQETVVAVTVAVKWAAFNTATHQLVGMCVITAVILAVIVSEAL